ncbi:YihY/virulence factor BrkB family protein [Geoanaerobacter pelophilus]|nr:YihY/virulence factor BrkB family protein [Geoanaerobacter pelophilus]
MTESSSKRPFSTGRIWEYDPSAVGGFKGKLVRLLQFLSFTFSNFMANNSLLRATALSFTTVLSLVPLLALAFSVLKGLGAQNRLAPLILKQVTAGSEEVVTRVVSYIGNTNMGSVGAIGLAALLFTAISMLGSVEEAFNVAWGVQETRSLYRKFSDYLSVLISAPLLLLAATSITTTLQSKWLIGWLMERTYLGDLFLFMLGLTPYLSVWVAIFLLYTFIPNTRVRYTSALIGAVFAGTLWQFAQWAYIHFQVGAGNYNAIYGTLAALPILMVWIYVSWIIVLFGMEVVAAHQNRAYFRRDIRGRSISPTLQELVALAALRHIGEAFYQGAPGWGEQHLAARLNMPLRIVRDTLEHLREEGFLVCAGEGECYYPARDLNRVTISEVLLSLRNRGAYSSIEGEDEAEEIVQTVDAALTSALEGRTLMDLAVPEKSPAGVDKEGAVDI